MFTKPWVRKPLKILVATSVILLVSFAVIIGIARSVFIYVDKYKPHFEQLATEKLHHPVKIERIKLDWHGINPVFTLQNVAILDKETQRPLIQARQFQLGVSVLSSLWHFRIQPSILHLQGANLVIHQLPNNQLDINGIQFELPSQSSQDADDIDSTIKWLAQQNEIFVNKVNIDFYTKNNKLIPLTNVRIKLKRNFLQHKLIVVAKLAQNVPARFRLVVDFKDDFYQNFGLDASAYLLVQDFNPKPWLQDLVWRDWRLVDGRIDRIEIWADYENKKITNWQALFDAYKIHIIHATMKQPYQFDHVAGNLIWEKKDSGWDLAARQLQLTFNEHIWPAIEADVSYSLQATGEQNINLSTSYLAISDVTHFLIDTNQVSTSVQTQINNLKPNGILNDVKLSLVKTNETTNWKIGGKFVEINWSAFQEIPGVKNLKGDFELSPTTGKFDLEGNDLVLQMPKIFPTALSLTNYKADIAWQKDEAAFDVKIRDLLLETLALKVQGGVNLTLPKNEQGPFIALSAAFMQQDLSQFKNYIPTKILNPELGKWLQKAFPRGDSMQGTIVLQGPLKEFPFDNLSGKFEMDIQAQNIDFNYSSGWPMLKNADALINFSNRTMETKVTKATIFDVPVTNLTGQIADLAKPILNINGQLLTDMNTGQQFILASPLQKTVGHAIEDLRFSGPIRLDLGLQIPFVPKQNVQVNGLITLLKDNSLEVPLWHVKLDQLTGAVKFTQDGLFAEKMTANIFGHPAQIKIDTTKTKSPVTQVSLNSFITIEELNKLYPNTFWNFLKGSTNYQALVELAKAKQGNTVRLIVQSDLKGVSVDLPEPWGKTASTQKMLVMELMAPTDNNFNLLMQYNNQLSSALSFDHEPKGWEFFSGEVRFGKTRAQIQDSKGLVISGQLNEFNWTEFSKFLKEKFKTTTTQQSTNLIRLVDLDFNKLSAFGMNMNQIRIRAQPSNVGWLVNASSPVLSGKISVPTNLNKNSIRADLDYLYIDPNAVKSKTDLQPNQIPSINLICRNFQYGQKRIGQLVLDLSPSGSTLRIDKLIIRAPSAVINATGVWRRTRGGDQTTLEGRLETENMGAVLRDWQITQSMAGGRGAVAFSLSWPTPIYNISSSVINGDVSMNFRDGRIINIGQSAEAEMGLGRVLNLFSLQTLPRRLQLDFSDLTEKGFSFDTLQGKFNLRAGNAFTTNAALNGPVAKVTINGRIGLAAQDYDLVMNITPYVTSSLPVIATIAGGPVAGAVTWVASKVIGGAVNKISTQVYRVRGTWDNPDIQKN